MHTGVHQHRKLCLYVNGAGSDGTVCIPECVLCGPVSVHGLGVSDAPKRQTESASQFPADSAAFPLLLPVPVQQGGGALALGAGQQAVASVFFVAAVGQHEGLPLHLRRRL